MAPRGFLTTIGATALGVGIVIGSGGTIPTAFAQETTPAVEAPAQIEQAGDPEQWRAQAYDSFVAALASELNANDAAVDTAIRAALKQQIAEQEAAGRLDADMVTELQAMIDEAEAPLMLGMGGQGGLNGRAEMHGFLGRGGEHRGPRGGFHDWDDEGESREAPAPRPSADDATDQSAPASADDESPVLN